jgi:hypothetical protein
MHLSVRPRKLTGMRRLASGLTLCLVAVGSAGEFLACQVGTSGELETPDSSVKDAGGMDVASQQDVAVSQDVGVADAQEETIFADVEVADVAVADVAVADVVEEVPAVCNAQTCGGACCNGQCVSQTCASCGTATHFCTFNPGVAFSSGTCVDQCSGCVPGGTPLGVTCFDCSSGTPAAKCASASSACPQTLAAGACPCVPADAGECPAPNQICQGNDAGQFVCITP